MASKAQQSQRNHSPELGDPTFTQQYNKQTGRPIRRPKKSSFGDFVDSSVIEEEDSDPMELPSEDEDGYMVKPQRMAKRKRSPSLTPPPLDPIIYNEEPDEVSDEEAVGKFHRGPIDTPMTLQFNIPLGFHGPLMVKLDKRLWQAGDGSAHDIQPGRLWKRAKLATRQREKTNVRNIERCLFTEMPPEIRNKIYRAAFVRQDDGFHFSTPRNFQRSAQFLRTCRLFHSEACSVLYGENKFTFERNRHTRAPFWEPQLKEIGYKDIRQFLKMIGSENLFYLRDVKLVLEDAMPGATPYMPSHESRRYVHDDHLIDVLRILRKTKLRSLVVAFLGRRALMRTDVKFLGYLEQVKADDFSSSEKGWYPTKVHPSVLEDLKTAMTRKKKLYANN